MMDIISIRRALHAHPELGFEENWTADFIALCLSDLGLIPVRGIAKTGLAAVLHGTKGRTAIGYRADMDALPIAEKTDVPFRSQNRCMHACGHDAHMAAAIETARILAAGPPLKSDVVFVFQPNEEGAPGETPSGAELMIKEGLLERFHITQMTALHTDPTLESGLMGVCRGAVWAASGRFRVQFLGRCAHAAYPERGNDALCAAAASIPAIYTAVSRIRPNAPERVSICQMHAGSAFNVIADEAHFEGISRGPSRQNLDDMHRIIQNVVQNTAQCYGTDAHVDTFYGAQSVINDGTLCQLALDTWQHDGIARMVPMNMASEDFSHFSERIPCFYAMMGVKPHDRIIPPLHADTYTLDESALAPAAMAMAKLIRAMDEKQ